jgi:hypothetical protein
LPVLPFPLPAIARTLSDAARGRKRRGPPCPRKESSIAKELASEARHREIRTPPGPAAYGYIRTLSHSRRDVKRSFWATFSVPLPTAWVRSPTTSGPSALSKTPRPGLGTAFRHCSCELSAKTYGMNPTQAKLIFGGKTHNVAVRQPLPQLLHAFTRDSCTRNFQLSQLAQPSQVFQSGVRHLNVGERQLVQLA